MVTGIEAAGLALAIFPIFLQCLEKVKDTKDYHHALKRLDRQLKMEKCKFTNTCRKFLEGMVLPDDTKVLVSGAGWDNPDFQVKLEQHLGLETTRAFTEAAKELYESLQELNKEIRLDGKQKVYLGFLLC
jgi:hypothetical protein